MQSSKLILATRGSALALWQSTWVRGEIERLSPGTSVELLPIRTTGDRMSHQPLPQIGGKGLFTKEIEDALRDGSAHLAVHSLKDLPTDLPDGLTLAAVPKREDPRDALLSRNGERLEQLRQGALVGTSSVRRVAQLKRLRPDLRIEPLRGNLDTRVRKLGEGSMDAIVLAAAGLRRMSLDSHVTEYFPEDVMFPAVGQGALGIEAKADDRQTIEILSKLEDAWTRLSVTAERALLRALGGGCQIPIAAHVLRSGAGMRLKAIVIRPDGSELVMADETAPVAGSGGPEAISDAIRDAESLGRRTAAALLTGGAGKILSDLVAADSLPSPRTP